MKLTLAHTRAMTVELLRYPAYLVPTLLLPSVFFLFFVSPGRQSDAGVRMATFAGFAVIGVAFFQFGVGIAIDRASPWEAYLRTLPAGPAVRLGARLISAAVFACAAAGLLVGTAVATTGVALSAGCWARVAAALLAGVIPFAFLGIALGYWAPAKGALPIANLLYLVMSYAGGLWILPSRLPEGVRAVSRFLPTRALSDGLTAAAVGAPVDWSAWLSLAGFAVAFAWIAAAGQRRDEGRRFS
jgi:ABC-2 type transport system permease protein